MNLTQTNNRPSFAGLKPIGEYKGPILKLTKADKEKIANYEKQIALLDLDMMKLYNYSNSVGIGVNRVKKSFVVEEYGSNYFADRLYHIDSKITTLREMIKQVKIDRLEKQKARLAKKEQNTNNLNIKG